MEKMYKKDYFAELRTLAERSNREDLIKFIDNEVELLTRKNTRKSTKPTKSATETADVAEKILADMPTGEKLTATQIQNQIPELAGVSNQRITAALKVLVNTGFVENTHEKGKSLFIKK